MDIVFVYKTNSIRKKKKKKRRTPMLTNVNADDAVSRKHRWKKERKKKRDFLEYILPITSFLLLFRSSSLEKRGMFSQRRAHNLYTNTSATGQRHQCADVDTLLAVQGLKMPGRQYRSPFSSFTMTTIVIGIV